jgi:hypothetical protein
MDGRRFDALTNQLGRGTTRRTVMGLLVGGLGLGPLAALGVDAKKKHHKKPKSKGHRCTSFGGVTGTCRKGWDCCDPKKSTAAGCSHAGYPVCCESDGLAHRSTIVCCASVAEGDAGICDTKYPNCCPASFGGCCEDGYPLCCGTPEDAYCCPEGTTCCESDPSGCCATTTAVRGAAASAGRGTWTPRPKDQGIASAIARK